MSFQIALEDLLAWNHQSAEFWKAHFDANPALLELPCSIDNSGTVQQLVRHVWVAELRWAQRIAAQPVTPREDLPTGPFATLFDIHCQGIELVGSLLQRPPEFWAETVSLPYDWLPADLQTTSRRKMALHFLFHGERHWAQLATLLRVAGFPSDFFGDFIFLRGFN